MRLEPDSDYGLRHRRAPCVPGQLTWCSAPPSPRFLILHTIQRPPHVTSTRLADGQLDILTRPPSRRRSGPVGPADRRTHPPPVLPGRRLPTSVTTAPPGESWGTALQARPCDLNRRFAILVEAQLEVFVRQRLRGVWAEDRDRLPRNRPHARLCLLYTSPSPRDGLLSRMPSSA